MKVLFISHAASRTGAPIRFLDLIRWLKNNADIEPIIILKTGGELTDEFSDLGPTYVLRERLPRYYKILKRLRLGRYFANKIPRALYDRIGIEASLIYSNTVTNGSILEQLAPLSIPTISAINELKGQIKTYPRKDVRAVLNHSDRLIACSEAVKSNLVECLHVEPDDVSICHGFIDRDKLGNIVNGNLELPLAQKRSNRKDTPSFLVCSSGLMTVRKGADLFVDIAVRVAEMPGSEGIKFVWVGGDHSGRYVRGLLKRAKEGKAKDIIDFVETCENPYQYFSAAAVFLSTSREDAFPLVCLEAASFSSPIICFENSGGMEEFVGKDCGKIVPYEDVDAAARAILDLKQSEELRVELGRKAQERVMESHLVTVVGPKIIRVIDETILLARR